MFDQEQPLHIAATRREILGGSIQLSVCIAVPGIAATSGRSVPVFVRLWPDQVATVADAARAVERITAAVAPLMNGNALVWVQVMRSPVARRGSQA